MLKRYFLFFSIFCLSIYSAEKKSEKAPTKKVVPIVQKAPAMSVEKIVISLQASYDKINFFKADFSQKSENALFKTAIEDSGFLLWGRTQKSLAGYYTKDETKKRSFFIQGDKYIAHQPNNNTAFISECLKENTLTASFPFLNGSGKLNDSFFIIKNAPDTEGSYFLKLVPKQQHPSVQFLVLELDKKTFFIKSSQITDHLNNNNTFIFTNISTTPKDLHLLTYKKPPQTNEIIDPNCSKMVPKEQNQAASNNPTPKSNVK